MHDINKRLYKFIVAKRVKGRLRYQIFKSHQNSCQQYLTHPSVHSKCFCKLISNDWLVYQFVFLRKTKIHYFCKAMKTSLQSVIFLLTLIYIFCSSIIDNNDNPLNRELNPLKKKNLKKSWQLVENNDNLSILIISRCRDFKCFGSSPIISLVFMFWMS